MIPVYVPFAFIAVVVGGLGLFSKIYRRRQAARRYEPWFPSHPERDIYITLLQQTDPAPSEALLKAALLRRAVANVSRAFRIREDKVALSNLLTKGSIGDDLWNSFLSAEKELEAEIYEVVTEANSYIEGWGSIIFQSASEILQNEKYREVFINIPKKRAEMDSIIGKPTGAPNGTSKVPAVVTSVAEHDSPPAENPPQDSKRLSARKTAKPSPHESSPSPNSNRSSPARNSLPLLQESLSSATPSPAKTSSKKKKNKRK